MRADLERLAGILREAGYTVQPPLPEYFNANEWEVDEDGDYQCRGGSFSIERPDPEGRWYAFAGGTSVEPHATRKGFATPKEALDHLKGLWPGCRL